VGGLTIEITHEGLTEWDDDASIAELLVDGIYVLHVREFDPGHAIGVLVLSLESDDWSAVGDLGLRNDLADVFNVILGRLQIASLVSS
jgi:hypothetical protein